MYARKYTCQYNERVDLLIIFDITQCNVFDMIPQVELYLPF